VQREKGKEEVLGAYLKYSFVVARLSGYVTAGGQGKRKSPSGEEKGERRRGRGAGILLGEGDRPSR